MCLHTNKTFFSVQAATSKGAWVNFSPQNAELISSDGTKFEVEQSGRLYYLNSMISSDCVSRPLEKLA